jgi:hypothetical protein
MAGQPQVNKNAPAADLGAMTHHKQGADVVWTWTTTIDSKTVAIKVTGSVLRTVAYRAIRNNSGRASQGGISAVVVKS